MNSEKLEGRYANYFNIGHNAFEFLIDCSQFYPGNKKVQLHTRIITSPMCAKALLQTLRESIERYEQTFGVLPEDCEEGTRQGRTRESAVPA